ncbi:hydrolase [Synechocystis sp. FACHB-383]|uniref:amidohydrolase family protein n=1 Tax=Synechocystis sp. FACHB-383 TaxID=2692864 RepID=UPI001689B0BC|nr:amidohydrolase family protein [Synechocystis sp. FACHB-383]MBD2654960.1 hydrolase [Synechocystis sp. FACHB-383]
MQRKSRLLRRLMAIAFALSLLIGSRFVLPVFAKSPYDIVILNGRVMDPETNFDDIRNVGIKDGRIATITEDAISGQETIDATNHIVAPGFIDTHFHWTRPIGYKVALRDGVTTAMDLEAGVYGPRVDEWYQMHQDHSQVNYGTASGHEFARSKVTMNLPDEDLLDAPYSVVRSRGAGIGWSDDVLELEQGNQMLTLIDEGLRQGALGVASTVGYFPGATAREMFEVQRVGANYGRPTSVHLRYTPGTITTEPNGAQEILSNAVALGAPAVINHYNNPGWQMVQELLVRLREQGHNVWGEIYPYAAGMTTINAAFVRPENWVDTLGHKYEDTMQDSLTGEFYTLEKYQQVLAKAPATQIVLYKMPPDDIPDWCRLPGVIYASDAMMMPMAWDDAPTWDMPYEKIPNTHPRLAGTHGTCFRLARKHNIPLMQILAASSYNPAKYLGNTGLEAMQERGRLQEGMVADIVVLDPVKVTDNSTYAQGTLPTTGIPYVLVNGAIVVKDSEVLKDVNPGQPIRFPVAPKPRFQSLTLEDWQNKYLVSPTGFGALDKDVLNY